MKLENIRKRNTSRDSGWLMDGFNGVVVLACIISFKNDDANIRHTMVSAYPSSPSQ
jgi:hypothetical protein